MRARCNWLIVVLAISALLSSSHLSALAQGYRENPAYSDFRGPIPIRDAGPFNLLFLQFVPESARTQPAHASRYDYQLDFINNTLIPSRTFGAQVIEDNEYQRLRAAWRYGIDARTEVGVFVPLEWRNGGVLDGIIKAYHHLVGLRADALDVPLGRDHYPLFESKLEVDDKATGRPIVSQGNGFGLGEAMVTIKRRLTALKGRGAAAVRIGMKLPTGNPALLLGSGSFDEGVSLDAQYRVGREVTFYGNLGYVLLGHTSVAPGSRPNTVETLIAVEYRPNHRDSFIAQVDGNGQYVRTGNTFADRSNVSATFGYQRVLDRHLLGLISFSEGGHIHSFTLPALSNIAPEFTLTFGLSWLR